MATKTVTQGKALRNVLFLIATSLVVVASIVLISKYYRPSQVFRKVPGSVWPAGIPPMLIKDEEGALYSVSIVPASLTPIDPPGPFEKFKTDDNREIIPDGLFGEVLNSTKHEFFVTYGGKNYVRPRKGKESWSLLTLYGEPSQLGFIRPTSNSYGVLFCQMWREKDETNFEQAAYFIRDEDLRFMMLGSLPKYRSGNNSVFLGEEEVAYFSQDTDYRVELNLMNLKTFLPRTFLSIPSSKQSIELLGLNSNTILYSVDENVYSLDTKKNEPPMVVLKTIRYSKRLGSSNGMTYFSSTGPGDASTIYRWDGSEIKEIEGQYLYPTILFDADRTFVFNQIGMRSLYQVVEEGKRLIAKQLLTKLPEPYHQSIAVKGNKLYIVTRETMESFALNLKQ